MKFIFGLLMSIIILLQTSNAEEVNLKCKWVKNSKFDDIYINIDSDGSALLHVLGLPEDSPYHVLFGIYKGNVVDSEIVEFLHESLNSNNDISSKNHSEEIDISLTGLFKRRLNFHLKKKYIYKPSFDVGPQRLETFCKGYAPMVFYYE